MSEEPRAYTSDEITEAFLGHIRMLVDYWDKVPPTPGAHESQHDRMSGLAFSILTLLDGDSMALPGCVVTVQPHEDDKEYHKSQGENWFEPGTELGWPLHERFYAKKD